MGYQLVRGIVSGDATTAIANGQRVIDFEAGTGTLFEAHVQDYLLDNVGWLVDFANFMYINSHFVVTTTFLVWLYLQRNESFYFVRNMFMIAMGLAIVGYALYPCAPPRMFADAGFVDTVKEINDDQGIEHVFVNAYAAVPSMHCGFSLMVGVTGMMVCRSRAARLAWALYPALVFFVVVVTANHFWVDGALGWMVAGVSALGAVQLARSRPAVWSFRPAEARA